MKINKPRKFKNFWILILSIIATIPIFISAFVIHQIIHDQTRSSTLRFGNTIADSLTSFLVEDFSYLEYSNINQKLLSIKKKARLSQIKAYDSHGHIILDTYKMNMEAIDSENIPFKAILKGIDGEKIGFIEFLVPLNMEKSNQSKILLVTIITALTSIFFIFALIIFSINKLQLPFEKIYQNMSQLAKGNFILFEEYLHVNDERALLNIDYNKIVQTLKETQERLTEATKREAMAKMASQVSHDIRSPLSVLKMIVSKKLHGIEEDDRIIIRDQINRINDIANNLILTNKKQKSNPDATDSKPLNEIRPELLSSAIENIVTEKRIYFRSKLGVRIEGDVYDNKSYGLFANVNLVEFKRLLSNIINNAVESLEKEIGNVIIHLTQITISDKEYIQIIVKDNGKGIPLNILKKLGDKEISFGKEHSEESGSGLGLVHAKTSIENWNGKFTIESKENQGTSIIMTLPKVQAPAWFASQLTIVPDQAIVIVDDDTGIHATWEDHFKELKIEQYNIHIIHLSTPEEFCLWVDKHQNTYKNILFLSDYELIGFEETGLDLLEKYKITNAALVTSHYENKKIRERCSILGIKLIPKMLAGFVSIKIIDKKTHDHDILDSIYIDDDTVLKKFWSHIASQRGMKFIALSSTREFSQYEHNISKEHTNIYLDSDLGEHEMRGEVFAELLHQEGYQNIFMASGHDASYFSHLPWIKVVEKDYPRSTTGRF